MGLITTDQKNPGRPQAQRFSVNAALNLSKADSETKGVEFLKLKNCLVDKKLGALVKRPGSSTETIAGTLGLPLGTGEFTVGAPGTVPTTVTPLANFAGVFKKRVAGTWSAVTNKSYTNFSTTRLTRFAQLGTRLYIAGGKPAFWAGGANDIERVGIPAGSSPITFTSSAAGAITTTNAYYYYTLYNSTTGLESDWSPASAAITVTTDDITIGIPVMTAENWDKIRIYRTFSSGVYPYLVATVNSGTVSYVDSTPDASLTTKATPQYDNLPPPTTVHLIEKYAQCIWMVDDANPYKLVFSKPYIGSDVDLEYYPVDNYVISNDPITGLKAVPGKLLVTHPDGVSVVTGFSADDFTFFKTNSGSGTLFQNSICSNGQDLVSLGAEGISRISRSGDTSNISREIDEDLQPLLSSSLNPNAAIYASTVWNPSLKQFLFLVAIRSDGVTASRVKLWGWSPELSDNKTNRNVWHEYTFPGILDNNTDAAIPTHLFHPQVSSDEYKAQQDHTFIGYYTGSEGKIRTAFRRDKSVDDTSTAITAECITGRIVPGEDNGGYKLFSYLGFSTSYSDPTADGFGTLKYLLDFEDPQARDYQAELISFNDQTDLKIFPTGLAKHVHLYLTDRSPSQTKILLSEFFIHYRERFRREGR